MCCAEECLAECLCDGTSLLPSHVRSSNRETKPNVGLFLVHALQSTQLLDLSRSQTIQERSLPSSSDRQQVPWQGILTLWLSLVALALLEIGARSRGSWLLSSMELITRGSQLFFSIARSRRPEPQAASPSLCGRGAVTSVTTAQCHQVASISCAVVEARMNPAPI